jgi:hypothetical protein
LKKNTICKTWFYAGKLVVAKRERPTLYGGICGGVATILDAKSIHTTEGEELLFASVGGTIMMLFMQTWVRAPKD